ncbi:DUF4013 domain-containing protein [Collinsella sp. zg1085]|uniref:DUF4013 domain-containing protein n=1 Tax=Collinsella sp. zg1085 TaxID=2844380 RepID=UPI001C0D63C2|nr:DUF4013 domain-containing protein [Collinsella sp. zg1085]QWT17612.1 DUF4013 domain-containing protein [Collinsella sp. zg1085]
MNTSEFSLKHAWQLLTRDKGWIKPILILSLVIWIPFIGAIVLLGYFLEWGRLAAWRVDAAPKQRGIQYGKVISTGWRGFLVSLSMGLVFAIIGSVFFQDKAIGSSSLWNFPSLSSLFTPGALFFSDFGFGSGILASIFNIVIGTVISLAALRATIYDSFSAAWRLDRIWDMISRDVPGFLKLCGISVLLSFISAVVLVVLIALLIAVLMSGIAGSAVPLAGLISVDGGTLSGSFQSLASFISYVGSGFAVFLVCAVILVVYIGLVLEVITQLLIMHIIGQWVARFDVARWGVSSAPLPQGVPYISAALAQDTPASEMHAAAVPSAPNEVQQNVTSDDNANVTAETPVAEVQHTHEPSDEACQNTIDTPDATVATVSGNTPDTPDAENVASACDISSEPLEPSCEAVAPAETPEEQTDSQDVVEVDTDAPENDMLPEVPSTTDVPETPANSGDDSLQQ